MASASRVIAVLRVDGTVLRAEGIYGLAELVAGGQLGAADRIIDAGPRLDQVEGLDWAFAFARARAATARAPLPPLGERECEDAYLSSELEVCIEVD
jgi:hypothetical protein